MLLQNWGRPTIIIIQKYVWSVSALATVKVIISVIKYVDCHDYHDDNRNNLVTKKM